MKLSVFEKLLCLLICGLIMLTGCRKKVEKTSMESITGAKALDFVLTNYDGTEVKLADYLGKNLIVLEWLNYDCPFVQPHYESQNMVNLSKKYSDRGIVWLAINTTHYADNESNRAFAQKYNVPYPILNDNKGDIGKAYHATNTPQIYIIDKQGIIVYNGAVDNAHKGVKPEKYEAYVDTVLSELLDGNELTYTRVKPVGCTVKYAD